MSRKRHTVFASELRLLLYAFGDVANPLPETVATVDDILQTYILDVCRASYDRTIAMLVATYPTKIKKMRVDDLKYVFRRDEVKLGRIVELLRLLKEIEEARRAVDTNKSNIRPLTFGVDGRIAGNDEPPKKRGRKPGKKNKKKQKVGEPEPEPASTPAPKEESDGE